MTPDPTVARLRAVHWTRSDAEIPVLPQTVQVLGYHWNAGSPWEGLDFARAEARDINPLTGSPTHHLAVPWMHPEDQRTMMRADPDAWAIYRVYPTRDGWRFHRRDDGIWVLKRPA